MRVRARHILQHAGVWVVIAGALAGCDDPQIRAYDAPKSQRNVEPEPIEPRAPARVVWTAPENWKPVGGEQMGLVAKFRAEGAGQSVDITVSSFPGTVGGDAANINRWRGQLGLAILPEDAAKALLRERVNDGVRVGSLALDGTDGKTLLGAIVTPGDGNTWFIKATTTRDAATGLRDAFERFVDSFRLSEKRPG